MLNLFPLEYWIFLSLTALGRLIAGQFLSYKLRNLKKHHKARKIISIVTSRRYLALVRFSGVGHAVFVIGLIAMFFITYAYVIPVGDASDSMLTYVIGIGYVVALFEFAMTVLSIYVVTRVYME